ncbi:MAG: Rne/Rng family ribonuclease [Candidatus Babeliales bacterium]
MKKILINHNPWQTRIALTRDELLQNVYFESCIVKSLERSFFKGHITKVLPGIQTGFVDINQPKAGFLHISEIDRELALDRMDAEIAVEAEDRPRKRYTPLDIAKILHEGEPILVQVSKEPIYEKGAKLSTCFTLPGRFIVLMPNIPRIGISKKIDDLEERARLKRIVGDNLPEGMGAIIRTSADECREPDIIKDMAFLIHTWRSIIKKYDKAELKEKIHEDLEGSFQVVRDHLDDDVDIVIVDNQALQQRLYKFAKGIAPEHAHKIQYYEGTTPLFEKYDIESQIEAALDKKVLLKSGGSLIVESTEAMTVVDVNTGRFTGKTNLEDTVLKTNMEAAEEVVRQLRLRNIGGLIVIDFIDMSDPGNRKKLFRFLEKMLKERDRFQSVVLKLSEFGLVQMTRKRSGKTLVQQMTQSCSFCRGVGFVRSVSTEGYMALRAIKEALRLKNDTEIAIISVSPEIFHYLTSHEYNSILELEKEYGHPIALHSKDSLDLGTYKIEWSK